MQTELDGGDAVWIEDRGKRSGVLGVRIRRRLWGVGGVMGRSQDGSDMFLRRPESIGVLSYREGL